MLAVAFSQRRLHRRSQTRLAGPSFGYRILGVVNESMPSGTGVTESGGPSRAKP